MSKLLRKGRAKVNSLAGLSTKRLNLVFSLTMEDVKEMTITSSLKVHVIKGVYSLVVAEVKSSSSSLTFLVLYL